MELLWTNDLDEADIGQEYSQVFREVCRGHNPEVDRQRSRDKTKPALLGQKWGSVQNLEVKVGFF